MKKSYDLKRSLLLFALSSGSLLFVANNPIHAEDNIVVKPGDTISTLSKQYNISPSSIAQSNNLSDPNLIYPGEQLKINSTAIASNAAAGSQSAGDTSTSASSASATDSSKDSTKQDSSKDSDKKDDTNKQDTNKQTDTNKQDDKKDDNKATDNKLPDTMYRKWYIGPKEVLDITKDNVKINDKTYPLQVEKVASGQDGHSGDSYKLTKEDDKTVYWISNMSVEGEDHPVLKSFNLDKKDNVAVYTQHPTKHNAMFSIKDKDDTAKNQEVGK